MFGYLAAVLNVDRGAGDGPEWCMGGPGGSRWQSWKWAAFADTSASRRVLAHEVLVSEWEVSRIGRVLVMEGYLGVHTLVGDFLLRTDASGICVAAYRSPAAIDEPPVGIMTEMARASEWLQREVATAEC